MEHTHIPIKNGWATFIGKDVKPDKKLLKSLEKLGELAIKKYLSEEKKEK